MLAVLYDVHGNLPALDAVLAEAHAAGATRWLLGGDYALFGAWPKETVVRLAELRGATWIRAATASAGRTRRPRRRRRSARRPAGARRSLATTPSRGWRLCRSRLSSTRIRCCHGSPLSDMTGLLPQAAEGEAALLSEVRSNT